MSPLTAVLYIDSNTRLPSFTRLSYTERLRRINLNWDDSMLISFIVTRFRVVLWMWKRRNVFYLVASSEYQTAPRNTSSIYFFAKMSKIRGILCPRLSTLIVLSVSCVQLSLSDLWIWSDTFRNTDLRISPALWSLTLYYRSVFCSLFV